MKTVIIGGGPAGMMSAISAAENRSPKDRSNNCRKNEHARKKTTNNRKRKM